jgi:hypothetical protein
MTTLDDVRNLIKGQARQLDPTSRYITELMEIIDASSDISDLERKLSEGCRGRFWAGATTFDAMGLEDKIRVNLITNETSLMRFEAPEFDYLNQEVIPFLRETQGRILSLPCSHGEEPVSLAIACVEAGYTDFSIDGRDIQSACIATARSGQIPLSGLPRYVLGLVDPLIMAHLNFETADVFANHIGGPYDFVVCRNFLGYFQADAVSDILKTLTKCLASPGIILLDSFIMDKHPDVVSELPLTRVEGLPYLRH